MGWHRTCNTGSVNVTPLQSVSGSTSTISGKASPSNPANLFLRMILESSAFGANDGQDAVLPQTAPAAGSPSKIDTADVLANTIVSAGQRPVAILRLQDGQPAAKRTNAGETSSKSRLDPFALLPQVVPVTLPLSLALSFGTIQSHATEATIEGKKSVGARMEAVQNADGRTGERVGSGPSDIAAVGDLAFMADLHVTDERSGESSGPPLQSTQPRGDLASSTARNDGATPAVNPVTPQDTPTAHVPDGGPAVDQTATRTGSSQDGGTNGQSAEHQPPEVASALRPDKTIPSETGEAKPPSNLLGQANVIASGTNAGQNASAAGAKSRTEQAPQPSPDDAVTQQAETGAPARQLALHLDHENMPGVSLQLVERDGAIRVAVRTPDAELNGRMQANLNDLVNSLKQEGIEADAWAPAKSATNGHSNTGHSDSQNAAGQFGDSRQPGRRNGDRRERRQRDAAPNEVSFASQFPV